MTDLLSSQDNTFWTRALPPQLGGLTLTELDERANFQLNKTQQGNTTEPVSWDIGAYVDEGSYAGINEYARQEVNNGAEALLFRLYRQPDTADIHRILKDIDAASVGLHCSLRYPGQDPAELFRDLVRYLRHENYDLRTVKGSVDFDPLLDWTDPPFPPLIRLLFFVSRWMPHFSVLQVNAAGFNNGAELADTELALALAKGASYLEEIERQGYSADLASRHLKFAMTVGTSYHVDVAKLRALRILWTRVLNKLNVSAQLPLRIAAHSDITVLSNDRDENERTLLTQAHAAAAGGADEIFLTPLEIADDSPTLRARCFVLNTQLKLRQHLTPVADPIHLNSITDALVDAAWDNYQALAAQGGFAVATEL